METQKKTITGYLLKVKIPGENLIKKSFFNKEHAIQAFKDTIEERGFVFDELDTSKLPFEIKTTDDEYIILKSITKTI